MSPSKLSPSSWGSCWRTQCSPIASSRQFMWRTGSTWHIHASGSFCHQCFLQKGGMDLLKVTDILSRFQIPNNDSVFTCSTTLFATTVVTTKSIQRFFLKAKSLAAWNKETLDDSQSFHTFASASAFRCWFTTCSRAAASSCPPCCWNNTRAGNTPQQQPQAVPNRTNR